MAYQKSDNPMAVTGRVLLILKLDAEALFQRIILWRDEYLAVFSARRSRQHFVDVFFHRYREVKIDDLKQFSPELVVALDQFYREVDQLAWYLQCTEDMPTTVAGRVDAGIHRIESFYQFLQIYLKVELEHTSDTTLPPPPETL
jgi:hypothetical protein